MGFRSTQGHYFHFSIDFAGQCHNYAATTMQPVILPLAHTTKNIQQSGHFISHHIPNMLQQKSVGVFYNPQFITVTTTTALLLSWIWTQCTFNLWANSCLVDVIQLSDTTGIFAIRRCVYLCKSGLDLGRYVSGTGAIFDDTHTVSNSFSQLRQNVASLDSQQRS